MTNKEKFKSLVSNEKTNTVERNRERIKNRARLRESQQIALKVLNKLDESGWSQRRLAKEMGVSPQQITKIVKGRENLTLETQVKLQEILDIPILATYYERKFEKVVSTIQIQETKQYIAPHKQGVLTEDNILLPKKEYKKEYGEISEEYNDYVLSA